MSGRNGRYLSEKAIGIALVSFLPSSRIGHWSCTQASRLEGLKYNAYSKDINLYRAPLGHCL